MVDIDRQLEIIKRGAVEIISEGELKERLQTAVSENRPLNIKAGFDPTAPDVHLGHTVLLRKLRQFQDMGHQVYFLIGDFTARIGDPSGQNKMRKILTNEEIENNASTYKKQVFKILDSQKTKVVFNSAWFDKMQGLEFLRLFTHYTVTRLLERDDFALRIKEQKPLYMSEFFYPILQGYDSVVLKADIEIGGTDQKFNLIVGRELQKDFGQPPQIIITLPLLEGTDGVNKMSKSLGNYIGISDEPNQMFGKVMSIPDDLMLKYYTLLTNENIDQIKTMHPKQAKVQLANNIIEQYYSKEAASQASMEFERVFSHKELPQDMPVYKLNPDKQKIIDILVDSGAVSSKNEARRLIHQGGVWLDGKRIDQEDAVIKQEGIIKAGKRRYVKIIINNR